MEKSLRSLELLLMAQEGLSIGQLVARTGLHRDSVLRLLTTLHALGWAERPASRPIFRVSVRFYALAHVFVQSYGLWPAGSAAAALDRAEQAHARDGP